MTPITVPDYQLIAKCGRGSYGDVYVARSLSGSLVALKIIEKNSYSAKEFNGLKYYCSRCANSPYLIKIFHTGEMESFFYYTMELADNLGSNDNYVSATLGTRLLKEKRLPPHKVYELALNLLSGLEILHKAGLVHRDIKPENVIFVNNIPKLSDIGLVSSVTATFSVGGTLGFIPPEKLKSSSGSKTETDDLYALGKLIYCAFSGNSPDKFPSLPQDIVFDDEAKRLNEVILVACNTVSALRFHSIDKFRKALTTSVSKKRKLINSMWIHRHFWLAGSTFTFALVVMYNHATISSYLKTDYVEIAASAIPTGKTHEKNNIFLPPVINNDSEFKSLMRMPLDNNQLAACIFNVKQYLISLGRKRFPELEKEYAAYLTSVTSIEELLVEYHPGMGAEIKTLVKKCSNPMLIPNALISWLSPEIWKDKKFYDLYCDCAIRSENIEMIFTEKKNLLPETLEWNTFLLASRQKNGKKSQLMLYKYPFEEKEANFEEVLAAYLKLLQNMTPDKKEQYCRLTMNFLSTLRSNISNPAIVSAEYAEPPLELQLARAKEIRSFAKKNISNYVLLKYDIPPSFFREGYNKQNYNQIKIMTQHRINNLPAVIRQREWIENKQLMVEALREKELINTSNPQVTAYLKAKTVLNSYLDISSSENDKEK